VPDTDGAEDSEQVGQVRAYLAGLPPAQREVMALTIDDYSPIEIAHMLGKKPETVRANLREARRRLEQMFPRQLSAKRAAGEKEEKGTHDVREDGT
jgi:RNA polymerase sigma factor (sigma-70 family)